MYVAITESSSPLFEFSCGRAWTYVRDAWQLTCRTHFKCEAFSGVVVVNGDVAFQDIVVWVIGEVDLIRHRY